ncbi:hypothetical protein L873DRAFT_1808285 [Choiromyces venosus 120613-1]|uniref:Uncharacterized protein n=1 Tax=Choiromyces venosus 120613-1 TaxID=1336337 RepID=A0A3N4JNH5_9PEZI|nr:hypothetical protein L873DRAFT_1808285 [Choiromyces venosus 120613-1]
MHVACTQVYKYFGEHATTRHQQGQSLNPKSSTVKYGITPHKARLIPPALIREKHVPTSWILPHEYFPPGQFQ